MIKTKTGSKKVLKAQKTNKIKTFTAQVKLL